MAEGEADRTVMFVVVTEADYGGTYSLVLGGVYGPYATESDAEQALDVAGFQGMDPYYFSPDPAGKRIDQGVDWTGHWTDPIGDLQRWQQEVIEQAGYKPAEIFMSLEAKRDYERFVVWFEVTQERYEYTPKRRVLTRYVLARQLGRPRFFENWHTYRTWRDWRLRKYE